MDAPWVARIPDPTNGQSLIDLDFLALVLLTRGDWSSFWYGCDFFSLGVAMFFWGVALLYKKCRTDKRSPLQWKYTQYQYTIFYILFYIVLIYVNNTVCARVCVCVCVSKTAIPKNPKSKWTCSILLGNLWNFAIIIETQRSIRDCSGQITPITTSSHKASLVTEIPWFEGIKAGEMK